MKALTFMVPGAVGMCFASAVCGQPLSGVYTCANANPGGAFEYGDIGDFFNDLESFGIAGSVVLEVHDDGGPFTSTADYLLGTDNVGLRPVAGLNGANTLTIRAAPGEAPVILGPAQPPSPTLYTGAFSFTNISNTTIEGLTIRDCGSAGIDWRPLGAGLNKNIRIAGCRIYNITDGSALIFWGDSATTFIGTVDNVVIENNMCWNCRGTSVFGSSMAGVIGANGPGIEWVVRHNTILHLNGAPDTAAFYCYTGGNIDQVYGNAVYVSGPQHYYWFASPAWLPLNCNRNVVYLGSGVLCAPFHPGWGSWQSSGYDVNGLNADPLLVNITPGFEDLHLQPGSPAIDFLPGPPGLTIDIDGDLRPFGPAADAGADEFVIHPAIEVQFNAAGVANAATLNLGSVSTPGAPFSFNIYNFGPGTLVLSGSPRVALTPGANCGALTAVQSQPASSIAPSASSAFTVFVNPAGAGPFDLLLSIANNDPGNNPFSFTLTGAAFVNNAPPNAAPASGFGGPVNGPFLLVLNPGAPLSNAALSLTDPEGDLITVSAIAPPAGLPAGVIAPTPPPPGHPLMLTWGGSADAANAPGDYTWTIEFSDAGSGVPVSVSATLRIRDLPPTHAILDALGGSGSPGSPYAAEFLVGDSAGVDLATISDPNTSQSPLIQQVAPDAANPAGAGFSFNLAGGVLSVTPNGALSPADRGAHNFAVQISDGTNAITIHARCAVYDSTGAISFDTATLPVGVRNQPYAHTVTAAGGQGALKFRIVQGALPAGLSLDGATGEISGTPAAAETASFTLRVQDAAFDSATQQFELEVRPAASPKSDSSPKASGCTAHTRSGLAALLALVALPMLILLLARRRPRRSAP